VSGISAEERNWAMIGHLSGLLGLITGGFGNVIGPLVVWLIKKDTMPFAAQQAKEALNFQLTWMIAAVVIAIVSIPLSLIIIGVFGFIIAALIPVVSWIFSVIAGIQAGEGKAYRYPMTIRMVK